MGLKIETTTHKIDKQQRYIVQHREIQPSSCNNFNWSIIYKNMESLCYLSETNKYFKSTILQLK